MSWKTMTIEEMALRHLYRNPRDKSLNVLAKMRRRFGRDAADKAVLAALDTLILCGVEVHEWSLDPAHGLAQFHRDPELVRVAQLGEAIFDPSSNFHGDQMQYFGKRINNVIIDEFDYSNIEMRAASQQGFL